MRTVMKIEQAVLTPIYVVNSNGNVEMDKSILHVYGGTVSWSRCVRGGIDLFENVDFLTMNTASNCGFRLCLDGKYRHEQAYAEIVLGGAL